jgi:hypothetical protein
MNWWIGAAGAWVVIAPFALGYSDTAVALWNDLIVGVAVALLGAAAATSQNENRVKTANWMTAALGLWLFLAPFILEYAALTAALWSDLIAAAAILVLSLGAELELENQILPF